VNELINLPRTAPITCAGVQFGAMHLAELHLSLTIPKFTW